MIAGRSSAAAHAAAAVQLAFARSMIHDLLLLWLLLLLDTCEHRLALLGVISVLRSGQLLHRLLLLPLRLLLLQAISLWLLLLLHHARRLLDVVVISGGCCGACGQTNRMYEAE